MSKALFISFYFPPCGSSSTARNIGFPRHLKDLGIGAIVLTASDEIYKKLPMTRIDDSFETCLKEVEVSRTRTFIPAFFIRLLYKLRLSRFMRVFFPFEMHIFWLFPALWKALKITKQEKIGVIISGSLPNTSHLIGFLLHKIRKIPWIADFQDPMAYRIGDLWLTGITFRLIKYLEKKICLSADGIVTHSPASRDILLENYPTLDPDKIICITNAYDGEISLSRSKGGGNRKFRIVHSGEFYGHYVDKLEKKPLFKKIISSIFRCLEYGNFKTDFSEHSAEPLLRALSKIIGEKPVLKTKVEVILNGYSHYADEKLIKILGLEDMIRCTGLTSYSESLEIINSADLLYFPLAPDLTRTSNYWIPSKIFPYLASLNPILAPIQEGDAKSIIEQSRLGIFVPRNDPDGLAKSLRNSIETFEKKIDASVPDVSYIKKQSRAEKTKELYQFILYTIQKTNGAIHK